MVGSLTDLSDSSDQPFKTILTINHQPFSIFHFSSRKAENELVDADADLVAVAELFVTDQWFAVEHGAVGAAQVGEEILPVLMGNLRVAAGDGVAGEADGAILTPADDYLFIAEFIDTLHVFAGQIEQPEAGGMGVGGMGLAAAFQQLNDDGVVIYLTAGGRRKQRAAIFTKAVIIRVDRTASQTTGHDAFPLARMV